MTIDTRDQLIYALGNNSTLFLLDKASLASQIAGQYCSLWRSAGLPGQGAIPTTAEVPTNATLGSIVFPDQTAPATSYLAHCVTTPSASNTSTVLADRLAQIGGFVLNSLASQTVTGMDLSTLAPSADRLGDANYGDVQWFLEVYTAGGATASNATINVTFHDGSTGNLSVVAVGGTLAVGRMLALGSLRTTAQQGLNIRGINSVILSASTGTAGNFGFTAVRMHATMPNVVANRVDVYDWAALGLPEIQNDSCLVPLVLCYTTSSGTIRGHGKIAHG